jgi:hypothetical protein
LCTFTQQAGCLIPELLDLRVQERVGWRQFYPASIFDTYAATAQRTTRSRMIMTFESVCGWSNTCRVDAQRLRLKPRDRLTTENIPCTRQPRTRKGWVARASDSIVPRSEMARRRASGALSRGAPSYRFKERVGLCLVLRDYVTRIINHNLVRTVHSSPAAGCLALQPAFLALWTCPRAAAGSEEHLSEALGPGDARQREISSSMASGSTMIRVDIGVKNALQTLLQHADEKAERRATKAPDSSRPATPRDEMQQLPTNLEHDAGTPTEATRAADAARPPEPAGMASTAPETLDQLGPLGSGSVARPLEESFFDELVSTSYSIEPHLPCPHTWAQCSPHHSRPWTCSAAATLERARRAEVGSAAAMLDCASWAAAGSAAAMLEGARRAAAGSATTTPQGARRAARSKGAGAADEQEAEQSGADVSETHTTLTTHTHTHMNMNT